MGRKMRLKAIVAFFVAIMMAFVAFVALAADKQKDGLVFDEFKPVHNIMDGDSVLADIANHCKRYDYYKEPGSKTTSGHEASHGISSDLRNAAGGKVNSFYCLKNRSITINEPKCRKHDALPFIPRAFQKSRYNLYMVGQQAWDDSPLYVYDEWNAYINGCSVALDIVSRNEKVEDSDHTVGPLEFVGYGLAIAMAADKAGDLSDKLAAFTRFQVRRSFNCYYRAKGRWDFDVDKLAGLLLKSEDGEAFRKFAKDKLGMDFPTKEVPEEDGMSPLGKDIFHVIVLEGRSL